MLRDVMSAPAAICSPDARHASLEYCLASKRPGHGCNSHSISCVQTGRSNNSIAAANSLTGKAQVQKSRIMQSRPAGNCCPKAISFNIGQASIGITHRLNKSSHTSYLIFMPTSFSLNTKFHTHIWSEGRSNKWPRPKLFSCWDDVEWGWGGEYFTACQVTAAPHRHPCHVYIRLGQMTELRRREKCQRRFMARRWGGPRLRYQ